MNRRDSVLAFLAMAANATPLPLRAQGQQVRRPFRIGLVPDYSTGSGIPKVLVDALAELGRTE